VDDHRGRPDRGGRVTGLLQDLARAVADVRFGRADVDQVRGVDVDVERRVDQLLGVGALGRLAPALRVREEELQALGPDGLGLTERVVRAQVCADGVQG
jgi:hypothetical protein